MSPDRKPRAPQYIVTVRCDVEKVLVCEGGTLNEVRACPWDYCVEETEVDQHDWRVAHVKEEAS